MKKTIIVALVVSLLWAGSAAWAGPIKQKCLRAIQAASQVGSVIGATTWLINDIIWERCAIRIMLDQEKERIKKEKREKKSAPVKPASPVEQEPEVPAELPEPQIENS